MNMPLVTVIVPIYNTSKYLRRCIDSIIKQSYENIEVILVDDGSTDSSPDICDQFEIKDRRVKVIHKENGGLSSSRNKGLDIMAGEWVTFVDSDDWIAKDTIEYCVSLIKDDNSIDIIQYNMQSIKYENEVDQDFSTSFEKVNSFEARKRMLREGIRDDSWFSCCRCLFRSSLIRRYRFREGKINEDIDYKYHAIQLANNILLCDTNKYYYFQSTGSITTASLKLRDFDLFDAVNKLIEYVELDKNEELLRYAQQKLAKSSLSLLCKAAYYGCSNEINKDETVKHLSTILKNDASLLLKSRIKTSRKILTICFCVNYDLTEKLIHFIKMFAK